MRDFILLRSFAINGQYTIFFWEIYYDISSLLLYHLWINKKRERENSLIKSVEISLGGWVKTKRNNDDRSATQLNTNNICVVVVVIANNFIPHDNDIYIY